MPDTTLDKLMEDLSASIRYQVDGLRGGQLSADEFQQAMAQDLLVFHTAAYMSGADTDSLDDAGRAQIIKTMKGQLDYLNPFVDKIDSSALSDAQIESQALSYMGAINASWWAGATEGEDIGVYPGDGGTPCGGNCRCSLEQRGNGWYWVAEPSACTGCLEREADSPYGGKGDG